MSSLEQLSSFCAVLLAVISLLVAGLLILGTAPWALIVTYWVVLTCKNLCDCFED